MPAPSKTPSVPARSAAATKRDRLAQLVCSDAHERTLRTRGCQLIAGVDEVGRGALFGPVVAAAVILPARMASLQRAGLTDSKQLSPQQRESLDHAIRSCAVAVSIAEVDAATIDRINIYQASRLAMLRAVQQLSPAPDHLLIDAMLLNHPCPQTKLIYGDAISLSIAAASVVAKVYRDALLRQLDATHPGYGLAAHKGYGTAQHRAALLRLGPTPLHRRSFAPVAACLRPASHPQAALFHPADAPTQAPPPETPPCP